MTFAMKLEESRREGKKEGLEEGREEGREEGNLGTLCDLVLDGTLDLSCAVEKARKYGVTDEADFRRRAALLGYDLTGK